MTTQEMKKAVEHIEMYKEMATSRLSVSLGGIRIDFCDMANGVSDHNGGGIRENYYPGCSDAFFQFVCDAMGWAWQQ
jgi:hypothetical protein